MTARGAAGSVLAAAVLWGTIGTAQELGAPDAAPPTVAALRSIAGGLLLVLVVVIGRRWPLLVAVLRRTPGPFAVAALAITSFQLGYFAGIRLGGVAIGTLVAIGSSPAFAGLFTWALGRPPGVRWMVGTVATVAGAAALLLGGGASGTTPLGLAASLLAGASFATYALASKRLLERGMAGIPVMAAVFTTSGLLLLPAVVRADATWVATRPGAAAVAWMAVAGTAAAYTLFARGLDGVDAPTATTLSLAEPLTAALLAVTVLDERLVGWSAVGATLLTVGLAVVAIRPGRSVRRAPTRPG
jgi:drug/metabolite transporter, DME family